MVAGSRRRNLDIWPGFVDALANLLMVVIFVLLLFVLGQYVLSLTVMGQQSTLERLNAQVAELSRMLSLEEAQSAKLAEQLDALTATLSETRADLEASRQHAAELAATVRALEERKSQLAQQVSRLGGKLEAQKRISAEARAQVALLNQQIAALREQLQQISEALTLAEAKIEARERRIDELGKRLNVALANKVEELKKYRSEFFARLKKALGDNPNIRIEGDRFVFQSELLFATGSAELSADGRAQVRKIVDTLKEIMPRIPDEIDWILRIDGHTDARPIHTEKFASNWELSTARALSVVHYMIELGVPPKRLAATGFGSHHPIAEGSGPEVWRKNRRIEIKLTSY